MGEVGGQIRSEELDAEREARRRLALAQVRQYPDPVLRMKANDVDEIDDSVTGLVERMKGLMSEARGVGLAAPQLGILTGFGLPGGRRGAVRRARQPARGRDRRRAGRR